MHLTQRLIRQLNSRPWLLPLLLLVTGSVPPDLAAEDHPDPLKIPNSSAKQESEMKAYAEIIEHSFAKIEMLPIPAGKFLMGSPQTEKDRNADEGPQHIAEIPAFWMGKYEITWDAYEVWMADLDILRRQVTNIKPNTRDKLADKFQLTQPTKPYTDMTFGMGKRGYPAICMTQHSARIFCKWLTAKTGRYYRLPTEAEWEYACRAGTTTSYHFGDDVTQLKNYAWYYDNSFDNYHKVGKKKPNPWGLFDMHGNVAEWVLDQHVADYYQQFSKKSAKSPLAIPKKLYPRVVRGGGWSDDPPLLRSAARVGSDELWKGQDPQIPQSIWYHTDALHVGFRIVRPLVTPTAREREIKWDKSEPEQKDEP